MVDVEYVWLLSKYGRCSQLGHKVDSRVAANTTTEPRTVREAEFSIVVTVGVSYDVPIDAHKCSNSVIVIIIEVPPSKF